MNFRSRIFGIFEQVRARMPRMMGGRRGDGGIDQARTRHDVPIHDPTSIRDRSMSGPTDSPLKYKVGDVIREERGRMRRAG